MVRVGIGCIIFRQNNILMGLRKSMLGKGLWGFPGGHLEPWETPEECAIRETLEETGLVIEHFQRGPWTNDIIDEKHYVTLFMLAHSEFGEVTLQEPEKCKEWRWINFQSLPMPLFQPIQNLLKYEINWQSLKDLVSAPYFNLQHL